jgi:glycosyltransferase involved in cell wall biosynthesis
MSWRPAFQKREGPEVSVVMPSFNHREFIQEAIASVLSQDVALELLIQDDCSTDGTWDLIDP